MPITHLRVLPRGTAKVPDYGALLGNRTNRFHGWEANVSIGAPHFDADTKLPAGRELVHVKKLGQVVEIPIDSQHAGEYRRHLRDRDLWPADAETAQECGVSFDPDFGGEHHDGAKADQRKEVAAICAKHGAEVPAHLAEPAVSPKKESPFASSYVSKETA